MCKTTVGNPTDMTHSLKNAFLSVKPLPGEGIGEGRDLKGRYTSMRTAFTLHYTAVETAILLW
ncbi:MAG: hypothetical protein ACYTEK_07805 [Planctomycetota bacterium]|jgi:hypothetical protein